MLDGIPVSGFVSTKAVALVYYLATTERSHTRETLAGLLWSEVPDDQARKNLRDILSNLRRSLAPYLQITRQTIGLQPNADCRCDHQAFVAHITATSMTPPTATSLAHLHEAVALYQGDFLAGFYVREAPLFEEWMLSERERLRQLALNALHTLVTHALDHGTYSTGIDYATRLLSLDPWREETRRHLWLLLAHSGQRSAVLSEYEAYCQRLKTELGLEPTDETTALYQHIARSAVADIPPTLAVKPAPHPPHNLPAPLTTFIGRESEMAQLIAHCQSPACRLISIVGAGGAGKTRLALHGAWQLLADELARSLFPHGIYFVGLATIEPSSADTAGHQVSPADRLAGRIATALDLTFTTPDAPITQLSNYLRPRQLLLVLDNFEHLLDSSTILVDLLHQAPRLKIWVTSRGRLNQRGEQIITLDGLTVPPTHVPLTRVNWERYSALQLFRHIAQTVNPHLDWTTVAVNDVARICQLVDGLPLGIELAASLVRLLPGAEIAYELATNLNVLTDARRDLPARHHSLYAVFEHSWRLLTDDEQALLACLSVFRGRFERAAAAYVWAGHNDQPATVPFLPLLATLVDNSLVRYTAPADDQPARYELLETVRQYAATKLNPRHEPVYDRHCHYYLTFVYQQTAALQGARQSAALEALETDIDNIRSAWYRAIIHDQIELLDLALTGLFHFYDMRSRFQEGAEAFTQAASRLAVLAAHDVQSATQCTWGKLLARQGWFIFHLGQHVAGQALLAQSLMILRSLGAVAELIFPLNYLAAVTSYLGEYEVAQQLCHEALALSRSASDQHGAAIANNILGQIAYLQGQYGEARQHCQTSLAWERASGNRWGMAFSLTNLGKVAYVLRDYQEARDRFQEGLRIRQTMRDTRGIGMCLNQLGDTAAALGDYAEAEQYYHASRQLFEQIGNQWGVAASLTRLGYHALALDDLLAARHFFHTALQIAHETRAMPCMLEALMGFAVLLTETDPSQAMNLAFLVEQHPAATKESKDRAAEVRSRQAAHQPFPNEQERQIGQDSDHILDKVVTTLLHQAMI